MKSQFLATLILCVSFCFAQNSKEIIADNIRQLIKHESNNDYFELDSAGLFLYDSPQSKNLKQASLFIPNSDIPKAAYIMNHLKRSDILEIFSKNQIINYDSIMELAKPKSSLKLKGLRIAIDPGHMAENRKQAKWESRYMHIKEGGFFSKSYRFYEADLAFATAYLLKRKLEENGAEVMITREQDMNAIGIPFKQWYRNNFQRELEKDFQSGELDSSYYQWLKDEAKKKDVYRSYFRSKDFEARVKQIDNWKPDITFIIHYNADGSGRRQAHSKNYCMAFIPGAFAKGELKDHESRIDFLRLLLSNEIKASSKLSHEFIKQHQRILNIEPVSDSLETKIPYLNNYSVATDYPGVYSRNLRLTRTVKGTLCFGESLLQENLEEARLLSRKDYCKGDICTSTRVEQVAEAYFLALVQYLNQLD